MIALINKEIAEQFEVATKIPTLPLNKYSKLDLPVSSHADMLLCVIDKTIFCYNDYYEENKEIFNQICGYEIIKTEHLCQSKYPYDIGLNVLVIGKRIFCKIEHTAVEIINYASANGYEIIDVRQGYSACSTLVIDENTAITSDVCIYNTLIREKIQALLVTTNGIKLTGYNCGFIGGSGCVLGKNAYFFGDITKYSDYSKIHSLLNEKNISIFSVLTGDVSDFGGVKIF